MAAPPVLAVVIGRRERKILTRGALSTYVVVKAPIDAELARHRSAADRAGQQPIAEATAGV